MILTRYHKFAFDERHHVPSHAAKNCGQLDPLVLAHGLYLPDFTQPRTSCPGLSSFYLDLELRTQ